MGEAPVKVYVKPGGQEVTLSKQHFVAKGGQGEVYAKGGTAYKIYHDPKTMIPLGKITELGAIQNDRVIKPDKVLCDKRGKPIGYTMRFIKDAWTLCQLFPKAFRTRHGLTPDQVSALVLSLRSLTEDVHKAGVLVVDHNEMNGLVAKDFSEVYGIDADSYQTKNYPATVIMASVADPLVHGHDFTTNSDWFSFGVVAFQMFMGIHPFKGSHPSFNGPDKMTARMKAGISVFNNAVKLPKIVPSFDVIPSAYRAWFEAIFENGKRVAPPMDLSGAVLIIPTIRLVTGTANLDILELLSFDHDVVSVWHSFGSTIVVTQGGVFQGSRKLQQPPTGLVGVMHTQRQNRAVTASLSGSTLSLWDVVDQKETALSIAVEQAMCCDGRVYAKVGANIYEVTATEIGNRIIFSTKPAAQCMEQATTLFDGVAVQNLVGSSHVTLFPGSGASVTVALPELDDYKVVDARCVKNVLMVVGHKGNQYDRLVFRFSTDRKNHDLRTVEDITPSGLNFTVLDTGVAACLTEDEKLELFAAKRGHTGVKVVEDAILGSDMTLGNQDGKVIFWRGNKVYRVSTK